MTVIDILSKYAYAIPLGNKSAKELNGALKNLFEKAKAIPKNLHVDQGTEFYNATVKDLLLKNK